jgi:hypothetical protein
VTREVIHETAATLRAGDTERQVVARIEARLTRAGVRKWLHTPYCWFGDRTRFTGFQHWEPDALPTDRELEEGAPFILDAAPLLHGHPADYAFSGVLGARSDHGELLALLGEVKAGIVQWAQAASSGAELFQRVGAAAADAGFEVVHDQYPASVLGHSFDWVPSLATKLPRIGDGFQLALVGTYAVAMMRHRFTGAPYPFVNPLSRDRPQGLYAMEPHVALGGVGAKFESILLVDGDETRWLDPQLFGEVAG